MVAQFGSATSEWTAQTDPNVAAVDWSPQQRALYSEVVPAMQKVANSAEQLGFQSNNPVAADFAALSAQYRRAYIQAIPSYGPVDTYLGNAASELLSVTDQACKAAGS